jgi:hypothetical protein
VREFARRKSESVVDTRDAAPVEEKRYDDEDSGIRRISKAESGAITRLTLRSSRQADPPRVSLSILTIRDLLGLARATVRESKPIAPGRRTWS